MRKKEDYFIYFIIGGLLAFSICVNILHATVIPVSYGRIAISIALFLLLFALVFYNQYTFLSFMILLTVASAYIYFSRDDILLSGGTPGSHLSYLVNVSLFIRGYLPFDEMFGVTVMVALCGFVTFYIALSLYVTFQFYFIAALGFGAFSVNWLMNYRRSDMAFVLFLFCFCVLLFKKMNRGLRQSSLLALYMAPLCLLAVGAGYLLPMKQTPWDNTGIVSFFQNPISKTNDFFYFMFNPKFFSFQSVGFTGRGGKLGGDLNLNNRYVMDVYAERPTYLTGLTRDIYQDNAWHTSADFARRTAYSPDDPDLAAEYVETLFSVPLDRLSSAWQPTRLSQMAISIGGARTGTLFRPLRHTPVVFEEPEILSQYEVYANALNDFRLNDVLPAGARYSYNYVEVDYGDSLIQETLRQSEKGIYQDAADKDLYQFFFLENIQSRLYGVPVVNEMNLRYALGDLKTRWAIWQLSSLNALRRMQSADMFWRDKKLFAASAEETSATALDFFKNNMVPYASYVYDHFTGIPETVPQRVYELARDITRDEPTNYQKAKAIENYLVKFPYTLTPGTTPPDRDFVDYFLFDGQQGYCTYYATAMAVLARCIGLPSRYLEGYVMPREAESPGRYVITNLQAHSWAEIYFEGFGWVPFEATAPYYHSFYEAPVPPQTEIFTQEFATNPNYEDYIKGIMGNDATLSLNGPRLTIAPESAQSDIGRPIVRIFVFGAAVLLILLSIVGVGRWQIFIYLRKLTRLPINAQAIAYFQGIIKMTRYYHYPILEHETPAAYAKRIGKRFAFKNDMIFMRDLTAIYYRAKYAPDEIEANELALTRDCYFELLKFIRNMRTRPIYLWNRYVSRKI